MLKYGLIFFLFSSFAQAATQTDEKGEYVMALGRKHYTRRFSSVSSVAPVAAVPEPIERPSSRASETQTWLGCSMKDKDTMTDDVPQKTTGVNTETIPQKTVSTTTEEIIKQMVDVNLQTTKIVGEDKETNTAPLDGSGKHLYMLMDKTTQTQSRELVSGQSILHMSMEPGNE